MTLEWSEPNFSNEKPEMEPRTQKEAPQMEVGMMKLRWNTSAEGSFPLHSRDNCLGLQSHRSSGLPSSHFQGWPANDIGSYCSENTYVGLVSIGVPLSSLPSGINLLPTRFLMS